MKYPFLQWACQSVSIVVFLSVFISGAAASSLTEASRAYADGDFKTAVEIFSPLAKQGDASAQFYLAEMHLQGTGVPQDYHQAVKFYRLAAEQGLARAQYCLGEMYAKGQGVAKSFEEAYAWWIVAAMNGVEGGLETLASGPKQFSKKEVKKIRQNAQLIWERTTLIAQR